MTVVNIPGLETVWKREITNRDRDDTYVYVIAQLSSAHELIGPVKVGISSNPLSRLQGVQTGSPTRLVLAARYAFWKRKHALAVEKCFHTTCAAYRLEGEWFDMNPDGAIALMEANLRAFVKQVLQPDELGDLFTANNHLGLAEYTYDLSEDSFEYGT